jgi:hypothetical protein
MIYEVLHNSRHVKLLRNPVLHTVYRKLNDAITAFSEQLEISVNKHSVIYSQTQCNQKAAGMCTYHFCPVRNNRSLVINTHDDDVPKVVFLQCGAQVFDDEVAFFFGGKPAAVDA